MSGPADTMQMGDKTEVNLQPAVEQMYVLEISADYAKKMLLGDLKSEIVKFHISNMLESFCSSKTQKLQITLEKEKRPNGSY